ncbi:hypothetical protein SAMN05428970_2574 [Agromyces sp. CF514]|nr:hypothetical protein SAMN05428970_2574 [Agromyces sp. CF514]
MTCWITEQTMSITTETALRDLDALEVPPSMVDLVTDTKTDLKGIVAVDVTSVCGDAPEGPVESDACNAALGQLNMLYVGFESTLDSWGPYL